jgi:hypothetical protein
MNYKELYDSVVAGNAPALQTYIQVKKYAEDLATYVDALKELAAQDFYEKWGGREQEIAGVLVAPHRSGSYDYSHIAGIKQLEATLAERKKRAQDACKAGGDGMDATTGEVIEAAVFKPGRDGIAIKSIKPNKG